MTIARTPERCSGTPPYTESAALAAAFDTLVAEHRSSLVAYATRLTGGDRAAAEDLVQEAFVRAWRDLARLLSSAGSIRGWLTRVTHNLAVDRHRARRARPLEVVSTGDEPVPAPDRHGEAISTIDVTRALEVLPDEQRAALTETILRDRTVAQAAAVLGVPVGTVKSRVFYGLRRLREQPQLLTVA